MFSIWIVHIMVSTISRDTNKRTPHIRHWFENWIFQNCINLCMYGLRCGNEKKNENKIQKRTSHGIYYRRPWTYATHTQTVVALQNVYQVKTMATTKITTKRKSYKRKKTKNGSYAIQMAGTLYHRTESNIINIAAFI